MPPLIEIVFDTMIREKPQGKTKIAGSQIYRQSKGQRAKPLTIEGY